MKFEGIIPPVITPLHPDGSLDLPSLDRLVDHLIGAGVDGLFVLGSSGQVAYLTDAERDKVAARVVEHAAGRVPVVSGAADLTAPRVIEQARRLAALGVDGVVITAPFYALNDDAEIACHFRMVAAAVDVPVIAYDVPVRVGRKLSLDLVLALGADGTLAAVKDSSGDDVGFRRLVARNAEAGHLLTLLSGHEVMCDAMALLGADGAVPGLGNVDPAGYVRLWHLSQQGDWVAAAAEQARLEKLFRIVEVAQGRSGDAGGIGTFKLALAILGIIDSPAMPAPMQGFDGQETAAVARILTDVGLS